MLNKTAIVAAALMALLFMPLAAQAVSIDFYGIDVDIQEKGSTKLTITFDSRTEKFSLPITVGEAGSPARVKSAAANRGAVDCFARTASGKIIVECRVRDAPEGRNTFNIELDTPNKADSSSGEKNTFITAYEFPLDTKSLSVSYKFPERATLSEEPPENSISPRNGEIKTDGRKIFIFWNKQNMTAGDIATFSASYTLPGQRESPINTLLIIPIIAILSAFVWFIIRSKKTTKAAGETAAVSVLSKDEKALFDILKTHEGKASQKVLVRESNFSKAKVSRLLRDLRERGIVEIEAISGRENRVLLKLGQPKDKQKPADQPKDKKEEPKPPAEQRPENQSNNPT